MRLILAICIALNLSSCFTQKRITKSKNVSSARYLSSLRPGKNYVFYFNDGYIQKVKVERIENDSIFGTTISVHHKEFLNGENSKVDQRRTQMKSEPFIRSTDDLLLTTKSVRTFNPILTMVPALILVSFFIVGGTGGFEGLLTF